MLPAFIASSNPTLVPVLPDQVSFTRSYHLHIHGDHRKAPHVREVSGDCPLLVTELQLHARRNPVFAKRYYALQDQQTRALAQILERFFEAQSVPVPMDPRDLAGCMTALAHGLSLQHPQAKPGARSSAGRVIGALLKLLTQR